jgi:hypothetical protein
MISWWVILWGIEQRPTVQLSVSLRRVAGIIVHPVGDFTGINMNSGGHNRASQTKRKEKPFLKGAGILSTENFPGLRAVMTLPLRKLKKKLRPADAETRKTDLP